MQLIKTFNGETVEEANRKANLFILKNKTINCISISIYEKQEKTIIALLCELTNIDC